MILWRRLRVADWFINRDLAVYWPLVRQTVWCAVFAHRVVGPTEVWPDRGDVVWQLANIWSDWSKAVDWMDRQTRRQELVPAPTALATSALWSSFLQVHAASGPSTGARSALWLVFRQLLGCLESGEEEKKTFISAHFTRMHGCTTNNLHKWDHNELEEATLKVPYCTCQCQSVISFKITAELPHSRDYPKTL